MGMIRELVTESDLAGSVSDYEDGERAAPFRSLGDLTPDLLMHEFTLALIGCETVGYAIYTIGVDEPLFYAVRTEGSNSEGVVFAADALERSVMVDSDMMLGTWKDGLHLESSLVRRVEAILRAAPDPRRSR